MCGIAGVGTRGDTPSEEFIRRMTAPVRHRGPDGEGIFVAPGVGLGMRRLAVIDLVTGDQPMGTPDGSVQVVFNGEIYNYRELRSDLDAQGYQLRTSSDTEVLPYLYGLHGLDFLQRLNGMFAIALWDSRRRRLLLARDRMGIKPLLYALVGERLYFASELRSILAVGPDVGDVDPMGLHQFLSLEYTLTPRTLLANVHKVPAGGWLTWQDGQISSGRFWDLPQHEPDSNLRPAEAARLLRHTIVQAVERQMVSDVPLGTFLSGGVDSSTLVAAMCSNSKTPPATFSVGFSTQGYDELGHARLVADHFGTNHHEERLAPDYLHHLDTVVEHLDQPIADFSVFPTLLVSRMARRRVTVALGGDGGDELFGGYHTYRAQRLAARTADWLPAAARYALYRASSLIPLSSDKRGVGNTLRRFFQGLHRDPALEHLRWMVFLDPGQRNRLYTPDFAEVVGNGLEEDLVGSLRPLHRDRLHGHMISDMRLYLTENILPKVDLMSMAVSLEVRVPFLDNEVVDLALKIPSTLKWRSGQSKWILKEAFRDVLPDTTLRRPKEGFSIPMKNWLRAEWNGRMHELLEDDSLYRSGHLRPGSVQRLMAEHESGHHNHSHLLWALMLFQLWSARFKPAPVGAT